MEVQAMDKMEANEVREAFRALEAVRAERSAEKKSRLLAQYRWNRVLRALCHYAYNTFKQYYIKQVSLPEPAVKDIDPKNVRRFLWLLEKLNAREIPDRKGYVHAFFKGCNRDEQTWYCRVLRRNLEIGITQKGINKAIPGLIPVYDVMLAESIKDPTLTDKKTVARLPEAYVLQYKIDGYRLNIHKDENGRVSIKTRSGLPVQGYARMEAEAAKFLPAGKVYDGEMVPPELFQWIQQNMMQDAGEKIADRTLFREAVSHVFSKETDKQGLFNIFDVVDKSEWDAQAARTPYQDRVSYLESDIRGILAENQSSQMTVVPTSRIFYRDNAADLQETVRMFHKFLSWGWEGVMIKAVDAPYEWKRSKQLWKMKLMDTADLEVLGVVEGQGGRSGAVGKFVCDYKGTKLNIGTGKLSLADCQRYFKDPNQIIGKTIEVAYQAESLGTNGEPVLDFARFQSVRKDK